MSFIGVLWHGRSANKEYEQFRRPAAEVIALNVHVLGAVTPPAIAVAQVADCA
jgi:hypothetical protein